MANSRQIYKALNKQNQNWGANLPFGARICNALLEAKITPVGKIYLNRKIGALIPHQTNAKIGAWTFIFPLFEGFKLSPKIIPYSVSKWLVLVIATKVILFTNLRKSMENKNKNVRKLHYLFRDLSTTSDYQWMITNCYKILKNEFKCSRPITIIILNIN